MSLPLFGERRGTIGRRALVRQGALAAAAGMVLGGGAFDSDVAASPTGQSTVITLNCAINFQGLTWGPAYVSLLDELLQRDFYPSHPGVRVIPYPGDGGNGPVLGPGTSVAQTLAGVEIPDVLGGCCTDFATYVAADVLRPLDPLFAQDNINPAQLFGAPGALASLTTRRGLLGVPAYVGPQVLLVNEGKLDALGLAYPEPGWSYTQAVKLWESASGADHTVTGGWRYGASLNWSVGFWSGQWLPPAWGGNWIDPTRTRALLDNSASRESLGWIVDLLTRKVACARSSEAGVPYDIGSVKAGVAVMAMAGGWDTSQIASEFQGFKWNLYTMPVFPSGHPSTYMNSDFLALNAGSKYPTLAWDLFKFVATSKQYQRFNMKATLVQPARGDMWDEWFSIIQTAAPALRGKNLAAWQDSVPYAHGQAFFEYEPLQAVNLISNATQAMGPPLKQDLGTILEQVTKQINALEANGAVVAAAASKQNTVYQTYIRNAEASSTPVTYPAPPLTGYGAPAKTANDLVTFNPKLGSYAVVGAGSGVAGTSDGCTFAGAAFVASRGQVSCRLISIAAIKDTSIASGAKVGLMVRKDLADAAASLGLEVALGRGIHFHARELDGESIGDGDQKPSSSTSASGLIGSSLILRDNGKPAANYLTRPVWLRLALDVDRWTAYTSLDGSTWTQAGSTVGVQFAGCWVGLYVTSHQSGHFIRAVFDNVSGFQPNTSVQIGSP